MLIYTVLNIEGVREGGGGGGCEMNLEAKRGVAHTHTHCKCVFSRSAPADVRDVRAIRPNTDSVTSSQR